MYLCVCSVWVLCYSVCVLNIVIPLSSFNALLCFVCLMFAFWCMFKGEGVNVSCWYETCFFFSLARSSPFWNVTRVTTIPGQGNKAKLAIQWKTQVRLVVLAWHLFDQRDCLSFLRGGWKPIEKRGSQVQGLPFEGIFFFRCRRSVCSSELLFFFFFVCW